MNMPDTHHPLAPLVTASLARRTPQIPEPELARSLITQTREGVDGARHVLEDYLKESLPADHPMIRALSTEYALRQEHGAVLSLLEIALHLRWQWSEKVLATALCAPPNKRALRFGRDTHIVMPMPALTAEHLHAAELIPSELSLNASTDPGWMVVSRDAYPGTLNRSCDRQNALLRSSAQRGATDIEIVTAGILWSRTRALAFLSSPVRMSYPMTTPHSNSHIDSSRSLEQGAGHVFHEYRQNDDTYEDFEHPPEIAGGLVTVRR